MCESCLVVYLAIPTFSFPLIQKEEEMQCFLMYQFILANDKRSTAVSIHILYEESFHPNKIPKENINGKSRSHLK